MTIGLRSLRGRKIEIFKGVSRHSATRHNETRLSARARIGVMRTYSRRLTALCVVLTLVASVLSACGAAEQVANRTTKVQALWYSGQGQTARQGVAEVSVDVGVGSPNEEFQLDLETENAQGAGPQWSAATWSAASVATLFSFRDPRTISMSVSIDGSIDGPSAGALLSAAMLALLSDQSLLPEVSMTGTINPDGSVGAVSGIPAKIRAAKEAGLKKVLIPAGLTVVTDPQTSQEINVVEQGAELGIEVVEVATVFEALAHMTGDFESEQTSGHRHVDIQPKVISSLRSSSQELEAMVSHRLQTLSSMGVAASETVGIRREASAGRKLLRNGSVVEAYSRLSQANYAAAAEIAVHRTRKRIEKYGLDSVAKDFNERLSILQGQNLKRGESAATREAKNRQQMVGLPDALAWSTDTAVEYTVYRKHLEAGDPDAQELIHMASGISDFTLDSQVSLGQAVAALMVSGNTPGNEQDVSDALTSYAGFLEQTGDASLNYYEQVVAQVADGRAKEAHRLADYDYFAADLLRSRLREFSDRNSGLGRQRTALSMAMSYYVATATLVVKAEILEARAIDPFNTELIIADNEGFDRTVEASVGVNEELLDYLNEEGVDSSYAHWGFDWGRYLASLPASLDNNADRVLGLTFMWYASLQLLLLNSQTVAKAGS